MLKHLKFAELVFPLNGVTQPRGGSIIESIVLASQGAFGLGSVGEVYKLAYRAICIFIYFPATVF